MRFFIFFVFLSYCVQAQIDGEIISRARVNLLPYDSVINLSNYCSRTDYDATVKDKSIVFEKIFYYSDSLRVVAYYAYNKKFTNKKPVIIFNRGSGVRNDILYTHAVSFKTFIDNGFVVIAPAIRGSEGGEGNDEIGGKDLNDIKNVVQVLLDLPLADTSRLFMVGESRGGIMTLLAAKSEFPMRAAATVGAITNMSDYLKANQWVDPKNIWPDFDSQGQKIVEERSAIFWANRINVPILLMNGAGDSQVSPIHCINLAIKLGELGKRYQLLIVDEGNHTLSQPSYRWRDETIINWFKKF